jgi:hypothetical protein
MGLISTKSIVEKIEDSMINYGEYEAGEHHIDQLLDNDYDLKTVLESYRFPYKFTDDYEDDEEQEDEEQVEQDRIISSCDMDNLVYSPKVEYTAQMYYDLYGITVESVM